VLLAGVEGVDFVELHVYQLRSTLPPSEVRSIQQILSSIRVFRRSDSTPTPGPSSSAAAAAADADDNDDHDGSKRVRFRLLRRASSAEEIVTSEDAESRLTKSHVCVII